MNEFNQLLSTPNEQGTEFEKILRAFSACINKYSEAIYGIEAKVDALKSSTPTKQDAIAHPLRPSSPLPDDSVISVLRSEMERFFELNEVASRVFFRLNEIV